MFFNQKYLIDFFTLTTCLRGYKSFTQHSFSVVENLWGFCSSLDTAFETSFFECSFTSATGVDLCLDDDINKSFWLWGLWHQSVCDSVGIFRSACSETLYNRNDTGTKGTLYFLRISYAWYSCKYKLYLFWWVKGLNLKTLLATRFIFNFKLINAIMTFYFSYFSVLKL